MKRGFKDSQFTAFRTLWSSTPFTDEMWMLICGCLNYYMKRCGKSVREVEAALATYKVKLE